MILVQISKFKQVWHLITVNTTIVLTSAIMRFVRVTYSHEYHFSTESENDISYKITQYTHPLDFPHVFSKESIVEPHANNIPVAENSL